MSTLAETILKRDFHPVSDKQCQSNYEISGCYEFYAATIRTRRTFPSLQIQELAHELRDPAIGIELEVCREPNRS